MKTGLLLIHFVHAFGFLNSLLSFQTGRRTKPFIVPLRLHLYMKYIRKHLCQQVSTGRFVFSQNIILIFMEIKIKYIVLNVSTAF